MAKVQKIAYNCSTRERKNACVSFMWMLCDQTLYLEVFKQTFMAVETRIASVETRCGCEDIGGFSSCCCLYRMWRLRLTCACLL